MDNLTISEKSSEKGPDINQEELILPNELKEEISKANELIIDSDEELDNSSISQITQEQTIDISNNSIKEKDSFDKKSNSSHINDNENITRHSNQREKRDNLSGISNNNDLIGISNNNDLTDISNVTDSSNDNEDSSEFGIFMGKEEVQDPLPVILPPGPKLTTIPALLHRLALPSFKLQYELVSKALFSLLVERDRFPQQLRSLWRLFMIQESKVMDNFLNQFSLIPYSKSSNIKRAEAFFNAGKQLQLDAELVMELHGTPPSSIKELIQEIQNMNISVRMNEKFNILLPKNVIDDYIIIFRFLIVLNLAEKAIGRLFRLQRDSYHFKENPISVFTITQFVVTTQTFFTSELAKAVESLEDIFNKCDSIGSFTKSHENVLNRIKNRLLLAPQTALLGKPLFKTLEEVLNFVYDPLMGQKTSGGITSFQNKAAILANTIHEYRSTNEIISFLDVLYSDYI